MKRTKAKANQTAADRWCIERTKDGRKCPVRPLAGKKRCRHHEAEHDPVLAAKVAEERSLGAFRRNSQMLQKLDLPGVDLNSPETILALLSDTITRVRDGSLAPSIGNSVAGLAKTALAVQELRLEGLVRDVERRLREAQK